MSSSCYFYLLLLPSLFQFCLSIKNPNDVLCKDVERHALLQFKHSLIDHADRLASWVDQEKDCCGWVGIVCDNFTGHVHHIQLRGVDGHCRNEDFTTLEESNKVSTQMLGGELSPSLLHLMQLTHLDLSCNDFGGMQVPSFIGSLGNLRYLNLTGSGFGGIIPPQLGNLSELPVLCLGMQSMTMRNMQWLSSLHLLHHLDMSDMDLSKVINPFQVINTLPSLLELHLSNCQLSNTYSRVSRLNSSSLSLLDLSMNYHFNTFVPWWIFSMTSLVSLDLSECGFHGPILGSFGFENLTALKFLDVSENYFMNSSLVLNRLSSIGGNLISLDISSCDISSSGLDALHNLTTLRSIDMSQNQLTTRIPKSLGTFCDIRYIDLSDNNFHNASLIYLLESLFECKSPSLESLFLGSSGLSGQLPNQLGQLMLLVQLDVRGNHLVGTVPDSIGQLSFLRSLQLSSNLVFGPIPCSIGGLSSLEVLELSHNQLNDNIPDSLGQLSNLVNLDLSYNQLSGSLPESLGHLLDLEHLDLSNNRLNGSFSNSLGRLSNLKFLYLLNNQLNGSLPKSLSQLSNLVQLDFSQNLLTGVVTKSHLEKLSSLKFLYGIGNNLSFKPQVANWIPHFQLHHFYLNSWDLGPRFPLWLQLQRDLIELDISNTNIVAPMPQSFWTSFPNLTYLDMSHNHIQGKLFSIPETLYTLDMSSNEFMGNLPDLSNSRELLLLDLSNNLFMGSLHHFLCPSDEKGIYVLNLGNNNLSGVIPECWMSWPRLTFLSLENNNLSGEVPRSLGFSSDLESLDMHGNKLTGRLPDSLMNLKKLKILQLGRNELVGRIPTWLGTKLSSLRSISLRSNTFDGSIPQELCYLTTIHILDLACNNLSGNIPRCFDNFTVLSKNKTELDESFVVYTGWTKSTLIRESLLIKGREYMYSTTLGLVMMVDLSSNNFSGYIPSELTTLQGLISLNLSRNQLTGRLPEKIGDMTSLESFDLSLNKLSGELPTSLSSLSFLSKINVSYNNFTGRIPSSTQFQGFNETSFFGNNLCGDPLIKHCVVEVPDRGQEEEDNGSHGVDLGLIVSIVCGFIAGFWIIVAPLMVLRLWRIAYFRSLNGLRYMGYDALHNYCCNMFYK